jgi:hypothetical protein
VDCSDVVKYDVLDVVRDGGGVAERADTHGAGLVAGYGRDVDVGAVAFD